MARTVVDAAAWTGRTGEWKWLKGSSFIILAWRERDHEPGTRLPTWGFSWGRSILWRDQTWSIWGYWGYDEYCLLTLYLS